ncbi:MAG: CDP-alcohol phosphatidyltransferase [Gammaproteobacteria bacterium HGW-Gammaproteobacteria-8]|nr:MAG: CDP-alcohol phosphatidyltransferase [Gammaproteobacteria bacterium HGW-Gammaproteobacteria-8]
MLALRDLPNVLTVTRMLLVAPLVYLLLTERFVAALILALIVGFSDWLDGALARRFGWQSEFGGMLDPLADKLMMISLFATLAWLGALPWWLFGLAIVRDLIIVAGGLFYHYRVERFQAEPTRLSKFNTLAQLVLSWTVLTHLAGLFVPRWAVDGLIGLVVVTVTATLIQYIWIWGGRARRIRREASGHIAGPDSGSSQ